jgi:DNA-binding response OmpR family regulator
MADKPAVLIVDDSRTVRAALGKYLQNQFRVIEADNGEAGWSALQQNPDTPLIVTDIQMPVLDGYGLICRIRASDDERLKQKPIIVITSADDETTRERAYACGADDFILKPLEFADLASRLQAQLDAHAAGGRHVSQHMERYGSAIEDAILEAPDIGRALRIVRGEETGNIAPYIIDLCMEALPLFQYLTEHSSVDIQKELASIKAKLESQLI